MNIRYVLPVAALVVLVGCKQQAAEPAATTTPAPVPVAVVNGKNLSADLLDIYVKTIARRPLSDLTPEQRTEAVDALVRMQLFADEADKQGLLKDKETSALLELNRLQVLQTAITNKYVKGKEPTEQELRAEYESQVAAAPRTDYHLRVILVQSEEFANQIVQRLKKGARFEQIAASDSADPGTKARGGDLGWVSPAVLPPPLAPAVAALKKGQFTEVPIRTPSGFNILKVEDTRPAVLPTFDQAKQDLERIVLTKKVKVYSDDLLKAAKVEKK